MTLILPGGVIGIGKVKAWNMPTASDFLSRSSVLTGATSVDTFTFSCWVNLTAGDGELALVFSGREGGGIRLNASRRADNKFQIASAPAGTSVQNIGAFSVNSYVSGTGWHHFLAAADASRVDLVIDGTDFSTTPTRNPGTIPFSVMDSYFVQSGGARIDDLAEVWLDDSYMDVRDSSVYRKFISAAGKPVSLGANGSKPTGSAPLIYLRGPAASVATNKGTGGDFTVTGTLTDASTSPSD